MYSSQQRAHITQPRRNPTINRYAEDSRSFVDTQDLDIDLTKRTATDLTRQANPRADSSYFDEESSFDDYASEASGSSFSSTASLVDQLGGTYDEPELLVSTVPSSSPSPPTPIIPTKAPKPVGVFSIADFMKNVQAPPAVQPPTVALTLPQQSVESLHKRSSAYSQSSKEPMTSIDPQDEENTWESGNQANDYDGQDHDDSSSGFPALDSSDNSVLSDPPMYDQNYDRSFEEEERGLEDIDNIEEEDTSPPEVEHRHQALAPSPAPSVPSSEIAVFSQVNPLFSRRSHAEPETRQSQATEMDQVDTRIVQSLDHNYPASSSANGSVKSHRSRPKRNIPLPPPVPEIVAPVVASVGASAPLPAPPLVHSQPFNVADADEIQFVVDELPPPPPPLQEEDRHHPVSTTISYTSPLKSDQLPAQLEVESEDVDSDIDGIHTIQTNEPGIPTTSTATAAADNVSTTTNNRSRITTNYADEYSTMGTYSHYFHTPLPTDPPTIATPPISAVTTINPPPSDVAIQKETPIASVPGILPVTVTTPAYSSSIERLDLNRISTPPAENTSTIITSTYSSPIANPNATSTTVATANPNSPSSADIALTTSSSRFRGRYLSPDKVRASLLTATATPAMSSPVPDTGRVDRFRNKKGMGVNGTVSLSDSMKGKAADESEVDKRKSVTDSDIFNATALSPATSGKPSNTYNHEGPHNTTDTAGSLYSNMETQSFSSSLRALNDAELLLQYKTSLLLQSQLIDKILQQRSTLLDSQDPEQQLRLQMTIDITTEMLQKSVFESSILSSAVFSAQPSLNSTATYTQDSNVSYSQSSVSANPAVSANKRSVSRNGATSRMLLQSNESVPVPPPLKHYTYGPHAVTATPPRTSYSAIRGSAPVPAGTQSARSSTPTVTATAQATRRTRSNTPNMRTVQPKPTTKEQSTPPPSPLASTAGGARGDALRRTPSGTIISSPLSGSLKRANSVTKTSLSRNTARSELDRVNHTYSGSGSRSIRKASTPANLVITPVKTGDDGIDLVASTMNSSIQLFSSTPLSHDTFRRNASLVNSLLGNIDNYCNCCRTKLIDMDAQKNMKLKHSQCRNCLHSK